MDEVCPVVDVDGGDAVDGVVDVVFAFIETYKYAINANTNTASKTLMICLAIMGYISEVII